MATTSSNARNVPSLVGWLDEISDADSRPYSEALFTTFGVDLGYFEGAILGRVRRLGAAVTILTDAAVYDPDPIAVSNAGSAYLLGPVSCSGSFHPKVNIFVGPERAMVSIGSGNLTVGGWQRNQETLVIAEGTKQSVPRLIPEVAIWLEKLQMLRLGDPARDALNRIVMALSRLIEHADTIEDGQHLVTSADGPLLDQLPSTKVTELRICAPFHDPTGQTFTALMQRYEPEIVSIAVQPGRTVIEPSVIIDSAAKHNARLIWNDVPGAYVHGKLIEAVDSTGSWMLTGSANLTKPALLLSSEEGG
ncbi:MAG: hypothetical protein FWG25_10500, partial [Promicromonosporaceae bacterium]|nr:hypothetical protein [Promicromonosporaceae bacterium]